MNVYPRAAALHVAGALLPQVFLSSVCFYRVQFVFAVGGRSVFDADGTFYVTAAGFFREKHVSRPTYRVVHMSNEQLCTAEQYLRI